MYLRLDSLAWQSTLLPKVSVLGEDAWSGSFEFLALFHPSGCHFLKEDSQTRRLMADTRVHRPCRGI